MKSETPLLLTLSWQRLLSYSNQSIDLQSTSVDWFLYDNGLRHERVKLLQKKFLVILPKFQGMSKKFRKLPEIAIIAN